MIEMATRSKQGKKLTKAVMKYVSKAIRTEAEGGGFSAKILCEVDELPQLELYPSRKKFLETIQTECISEFENLINNNIYAINIQKCCWHVMGKTAT